MEHNMHAPLRIRKRERRWDINFHSLLLIPYMMFIVLLILLPVIFIVIYAVLRGDAYGFIQGINFTLDNIIDFIQNGSYMSNLFNSLRLALIATVICILIAYPLAFWISKRKPVTQASLILLVTAPMWLNMILRLLALRQLFEGFLLTFLGWFGFQGQQINGTYFAIVYAMVFIYIPFMVLPIFAFLSKMDTKLLEASTDLGASKLATFIKVTLPLSIPGVLSGVTIVLLGAATTVVIPAFVGGGNIWLIGTVIEHLFMQGGRASWFIGSAAGVVLLSIILVLMWLINRLDRRKAWN